MKLPKLLKEFSLQRGFKANSSDLKVKNCSKYGVAREKRKTEQRMQRKTTFFRHNFRRNFPRFFREWFSAARKANVAYKRSPNISTQKIQHCGRIQSRVPTRWSCEPNQCAYASSAKDLENWIFFQLAALRPSSHQQINPAMAYSSASLIIFHKYHLTLQARLPCALVLGKPLLLAAYR